MRVTSDWTSAIMVALVPICVGLIVLYSDVQGLKTSKADTKEVLELKVDFTKQMTRNTVAIENLNETLITIRAALHENGG